MSYKDYIQRIRSEKVLKLQEIVKNQNGIWLNAEKYDHSDFTCIIQCKNNHEFTVHCRRLEKGSWCQHCNGRIFYGETITRIIIEEMMGEKFEKTRKIKELNRLYGYALEIDGYNEKLGIGFEYQGFQHFKYIPYIHKNEKGFLDLIKRDNIKKEFFENNNMILLEINQFKNFNIIEIISLIDELLTTNKITHLSNPVTIMEVLKKRLLEELAGSNRFIKSKDFKESRKKRTDYNQKYSDDELINLAKTYEGKREFIKEHPNMAQIISKRHLQSRAYDHMVRSKDEKKPIFKKYTDEDLILLARQYDTHKEMKKFHPVPYRIIYLRNLQKVSFAHFKTKKRVYST